MSITKQMLRAFGGACTILCLMRATPAWPNSDLAPFRPISDDEKLINSCEIADAIVAVTVQDIYTDFYRDKTGSGEQGVMVRIAECSVTTVLKGQLEAGSRIRVQLNVGNIDIADINTCGIMFLFNAPIDQNKWRRGQHGSVPNWKLYTGQNLYDNGFAREACAGSGLYSRKVTTALDARQPQRLAAQADIVLVADIPVQLEMCEVNGSPRACVTLDHYEQLYGDKVAAPVRVASPMPGYLAPGRHLLYLKRENQAYEPIGLSAGTQAIVDGRVGHDRIDLTDVRQQIGHAEFARTNAEREGR